MNISTLRLALLTLIAFLAMAAFSTQVRAEEEGVHVSLINDEDGDEAILMESEWISMHLLPWRQALIDRFVFRPSGNDIVESTNSKIRMAGGGGMLMDCFWEQDWRFQELGYKPYQYTITKNGPDEAQVVFETDIVGWLGSNNSGIISKLLSNMTLRRTVTIKAGQPFFRFDFEFINNDKNAKRPSFWIHNASQVNTDGSDTVLRPTVRGLDAIGGNQDAYPAGQAGQFLHDFNQGWSARISESRKEGVIYLMDYDATETLYNCGNTTEEWWYDGILVFHNRPWAGRIYILPIIGLSHVDYANEFFIVEANSHRQNGTLSIDYNLTSSYEKAARVTLNTEVVSGAVKGNPVTTKLKSLTFEGLSIQPNKGHIDVDMPDEGPLQFNISAYVELPDGSTKKFDFQRLDMGNYPLKKNVDPKDQPIFHLDRKVRNPLVPEPPADICINKNAFNVFGIYGLGSSRLHLSDATNLIPNSRLDIGYCVGNDPAQSGLSDFPYDYERLYDYRVLEFSNIQDKEFRRVGASILLPWLKAGGGLVITGGPNAFTYELEEHAINNCYPVIPKLENIKRGPLQLKPPEIKDHPIFKGIDLSKLPYLYYYHDIALKPLTKAEVDAKVEQKVLMKVGDFPFIIEKKNGDQITIVVTANGFGDEKYFPGKTQLTQWSEWPKLYANILKYAGHCQ